MTAAVRPVDLVGVVEQSWGKVYVVKDGDTFKVCEHYPWTNGADFLIKEDRHVKPLFWEGKDESENLKEVLRDIEDLYRSWVDQLIKDGCL